MLEVGFGQHETPSCLFRKLPAHREEIATDRALADDSGLDASFGNLHFDLPTYLLPVKTLGIAAKLDRLNRCHSPIQQVKRSNFLPRILLFFSMSAIIAHVRQ